VSWDLIWQGCFTVLCSVAFGKASLGPFDYSFYARWCGSRETQLRLGAYYVIQGLVGLVMMGVAHLGPNQWEPIPVDFVNGIFYAFAAQAVLRAQVAVHPLQQTGAPMSLLRLTSDQILKNLDGRASASIAAHLDTLDDTDLCQYAADLFYQHLERDASVTEAARRIILSDLKRNNKVLQTGTPAEAPIARAALKGSSISILTDYKPPPPTSSGLQERP